MNKYEALEAMKKGCSVSNSDFSDDEFLVYRNGMYDESGYNWNERDFNLQREDGWFIYFDPNNMQEHIKQSRNDKCICGSGKKFKKCCYLTQDKTIGEQNIKFRRLKELHRAIDSEKSLNDYKRDARAKSKALLSIVESFKHYFI